MKTETLGFKVEGEYLTDFFREHLLDGDSHKTIIMFQESLCGIQLSHVKSILKGEHKLEGVNDLEFVEDNGLDDRYMKDLCWVYRKERCVPGVWTEKELESWMKDVPVPEENKPLLQTINEMVDSAAHRGYGFDTDDNGKVHMVNTSIGAAERKALTKSFANQGLEDRDAILNSYLNGMKHNNDISDDPSAEPPQPHTLTPEDQNHHTWLIDPQGNLYKIPWQRHDDWVKHYANFLPFSKYIEATKHGWVRVSGGPGLGVVIDFDATKGANKTAILKHIAMYACFTFTMDISNTKVFEINIDYKHAKRLVNEAFKDVKIQGD